MKKTSESSKTRIESFLTKHEQVLLWMLCLIAMLRVFFFSAAFPFFNNVDEGAHLDTVIKYSKGYLPRKESANHEYESAELIVLYASPEYFKSSKDIYSEGISTPLWQFDRKQISQHIGKQIDDLTEMRNNEAFSPPTYYALAGTWYNLGKLCGLTGGHLLYWIRCLNVPVYAILFWFAHLFIKKVYKNNLFMRFSILLLLTFFPQDVFYSINSDVLSALFSVISFYLFIQIHNANRSLLFHFLTGIVVSATFLIKLPNCAILIIFTILIFFRIKKLLKASQLKEQLPNILLLAAGCLLLIIPWLGWNAFVLGDITGNAEKVRFQGMTVKPFSEIWNHPIFSLKGLTIFVNDLLKTFWRGEFVWGLQTIASRGMDLFYVISSCAFVLLSVINSIVSKDDNLASHRFINLISALLLFFFILFLAILSTVYDFSESYAPSREHPFFSEGRLILGALIPFLILYVDGLRIIVSKIKARIILPMIILFICILIAYSEIRMTLTVLESNYNWFHMF